MYGTTERENAVMKEHQGEIPAKPATRFNLSVWLHWQNGEHMTSLREFIPTSHGIFKLRIKLYDL